MVGSTFGSATTLGGGDEGTAADEVVALAVAVALAVTAEDGAPVETGMALDAAGGAGSLQAAPIVAAATIPNKVEVRIATDFGAARAEGQGRLFDHVDGDTRGRSHAVQTGVRIGDGRRRRRIRYRSDDDRSIRIATDKAHGHFSPRLQRKVRPVPCSGVILQHPNRAGRGPVTRVVRVEEEAYEVTTFRIEVGVATFRNAMAWIDDAGHDPSDARLGRRACRSERTIGGDCSEGVLVRRAAGVEAADNLRRDVLDLGYAKVDRAELGVAFDSHAEACAEGWGGGLANEYALTCTPLFGTGTRHRSRLRGGLVMGPVLDATARKSVRQRVLAGEIDVRRAVVVIVDRVKSRNEPLLDAKRVEVDPFAARPILERLALDPPERLCIVHEDELRTRFTMLEEKADAEVFREARNEREVALLVLGREVARGVVASKAERRGLIEADRVELLRDHRRHAEVEEGLGRLDHRQRMRPRRDSERVRAVTGLALERVREPDDHAVKPPNDVRTGDVVQHDGHAGTEKILGFWPRFVDNDDLDFVLEQPRDGFAADKPPHAHRLAGDRVRFERDWQLVIFHDAP